MSLNSEQDNCARLITLWMLYASDVSNRPFQPVMANSRALLEEFSPHSDRLWINITQRVDTVYERIDALNAEIQALSPRWRLDRMAAIDRNLLRLGTSELLSGINPPLVTINACIELAKTYGDKSTPAFVNGLLDQFCKNHGISVS